MPALVWRYLTALRYDRPAANCTALAEVLGTVAHDRLTRLRQGQGSGHTRLEAACRRRFVGERGALSSAATVMPKPLATALAGLTWVCSSQERQPVYGFSLVLLVWTEGVGRLPRGLRLGRQGGPSKYDHASDGAHG